MTPRNQTITPLAAQVLAHTHTSDQLEAAIKTQGELVEFHHTCGRNEPARIAFQTVRRLVALRTPETVEAMEWERDLHQLGRIEEQREDAYQESLREL